MLAEAAMEGAFLAWFLEGPRPTHSTSADLPVDLDKKTFNSLNDRRFHLEPELEGQNARRGYAIAIAIMGLRPQCSKPMG